MTDGSPPSSGLIAPRSTYLALQSPKEAEESRIADAVTLAMLEIRYAAEKGAELLAEVFAEGSALIANNPGGNNINPNRPLIDKIAQALTHAALISRCIHHSKGNRLSNARDKAFHALRAKVVGERLSGLDLTVLNDRDVRDSIEHLEDHVERFMARRSAMPRPMLMYNMMLTRRSTFPFPTAFCRVYVCDEERFDNLTTSIHLRPLRDTLALIADHLRTEHEPSGGMMLG